LEVKVVDTEKFDKPPVPIRIIKKIFPRFIYHFQSRKLSKEIERIYMISLPDIFFAYKGIMIRQETFNKIRSFKVHFHPDDSSNSSHRTPDFDLTESLYDVIFTPREIEVKEIHKRTSQPVYYLPFAYDPDWHFPPTNEKFSISKEFLVGFIGFPRKDRSNYIYKVASIYRKQFLLVGPKWKRNLRIRTLATVKSGKFGPDFSRAVWSTRMQIGFLNSQNRDQDTARTYEIAASGGLFVGQRTLKHLELFQEGKEAFFFSSIDELLEVIDYVKNNLEHAYKIANAGHKKMVLSSNTWFDRAGVVLAIYEDMNQF
jgi:hypothetical protein